MTRVRDRDSRCCITGDLVAGEDYTGFEAVHIFPLGETDIVSSSICIHADLTSPPTSGIIWTISASSRTIRLDLDWR